MCGLSTGEQHWALLCFDFSVLISLFVQLFCFVEDFGSYFRFSYAAKKNAPSMLQLPIQIHPSSACF